MRKPNILLILLFLSLILIVFYIYLIKYNKGCESFESNSSTCVIYKLHEKHGLFADLFFLIETYIRTKRSNFDFYIDSSNWSYSYDKGWHDYFTSFNEISNTIKDRYNNIFYCSHGKVNADIDGQSDITLQDFVNIIPNVFILKNDIIQKAQENINKYGTYEAIYIRRGDKHTSGESPFMPTRSITNQIHFNESLPLFVQSDDFTEVENIQSIFPNKKIYTIIPNNRRGAHEKERQYITRDQKRESTEELLMGVYICTKASKCWVDILSNVSRFIKLSSINSVYFYKIGDEIPNFNINKSINTISYRTAASPDAFL